MKPDDDTPDFCEVTGLWREWLTKRAVPTQTIPIDEALAKLRSARALRRPPLAASAGERRGRPRCHAPGVAAPLDTRAAGDTRIGRPNLPAWPRSVPCCKRAIFPRPDTPLRAY